MNANLPVGWVLAYELRLPEPTILANVWQRMHWAEKKKYMTRLAWLVRAAAGNTPSHPLTRSRIHVKRFNPKPFPDYDGLIGGLKPLLDVLVCPRLRHPLGLGFIVDDSSQFLERLTAEPLPAARGEGWTVVYIYKPGVERKAA